MGKTREIAEGGALQLDLQTLARVSGPFAGGILIMNGDVGKVRALGLLVMPMDARDGM